MQEILKSIIKETYNNVKEEGSHNYLEITDNDLDIMAENIVCNDEFWNMIDSFILEELQDYEEE